MDANKSVELTVCDECKKGPAMTDDAKALRDDAPKPDAERTADAIQAQWREWRKHDHPDTEREQAIALANIITTDSAARSLLVRCLPHLRAQQWQMKSVSEAEDLLALIDEVAKATGDERKERRCEE